MTGNDERELVRLLQRGDAEAAWKMLMTFGPAMHRVAHRITGDSDQADDVVQEAFLRVLRKGECYRGGSLAGWLRTLCVRLALNALRSERRAGARAREYFEDREGWRSDSGDPILRDALRDQIARLPEEERIVFMLAELEDWSHAEVGQALNITPDASRQRLLKARQRLRAALQLLRDSND